MNRPLRSLSILAASAALTATTGSAAGASDFTDVLTSGSQPGVLAGNPDYDPWFSLWTRSPDDDTQNDDDPDHDHGHGNDDDDSGGDSGSDDGGDSGSDDGGDSGSDDGGDSGSDDGGDSGSDDGGDSGSDDGGDSGSDDGGDSGSDDGGDSGSDDGGDSGEIIGDDTPDTTDPGDSTPDTLITPDTTGTATSAGETAGEVTETVEELVPTTPVATWSMPVQGKTFVVGALSGEIRVRRPGSRRSHVLEGIENVPTGSRIDTRSGVLVLVSALPNKRYQAATFKDGRFDAVQKAKGDGTVDLILRGKTGCGGNGEADPLLAQSSAKKAKGRRLWASDDRGRFRTHGRDSVATVRGTEWITEDTCDGTRTTVVKGAVQVRDKHTGRKKLVRAGQSHLVRTR